jgi:hypothetical protein
MATDSTDFSHGSPIRPNRATYEVGGGQAGAQISCELAEILVVARGLKNEVRRFRGQPVAQIR